MSDHRENSRDLEMPQHIETKSSADVDLELSQHIETKKPPGEDLDMPRGIQAKTPSSIDLDIVDMSEEMHETTPLSVDYDRQHNIDMDGTTPRTRERVRCCFGRPLAWQHFVPNTVAIVVSFNMRPFIC